MTLILYARICLGILLVVAVAAPIYFREEISGPDEAIQFAVVFVIVALIVEALITAVLFVAGVIP